MTTEARAPKTIAEKLLVAAATLPPEGFSAEDLVVAAWRAFPDAFGLKGYIDDAGTPLYPDSNRVFAEIMGTKPVRKLGLIEKPGNRTYRLTAAGRQRADAFGAGDAGERKASLNEDTRSDLRRYLGSRAYVKFRSGREEEVSFNDACGFWGISPRSVAKDVLGRRGHLEGTVEAAARALGGDAARTLDHGGTRVTKEDLDRLAELDRFLEKRFADELAVIARRKTER